MMDPDITEENAALTPWVGLRARERRLTVSSAPSRKLCFQERLREIALPLQTVWWEATFYVFAKDTLQNHNFFPRKRLSSAP